MLLEGKGAIGGSARPLVARAYGVNASNPARITGKSKKIPAWRETLQAGELKQGGLYSSQPSTVAGVHHGLLETLRF